MHPETQDDSLTRADVLNAAMARCEQSQAKLAKALDQAEATISRWRTGKAIPDTDGLLRLAHLTGLPAADVLRVFGKDPERLGLTGGPTTVPPSTYDLRLLRVGEMLARVAQDVLAMATASQPDYDPKGLPSRPQHTGHYDDQDHRELVRIGPGRITRMGDRRSAAMGA